MKTEKENTKEKEFHNSRTAFIIMRHFGDDEVEVLPKGYTHKQYLGWKYESAIKYSVRGYLKDRVLMIYQGEDFGVPTEKYDLDKILKALRITKRSLDYIGLGCKVGEVGDEWEPIEKIEFGPSFKYISYMITIGGDAGWRFSNQSEWCSNEGYLLFDSEKWTMEAIANEMKIAWRSYWNGKHGSTFSEKYDNGIVGVRNLINKDGVYVWGDKGMEFGIEGDKVINPSITEVESWNIDGNTTNYDYSK